MTPNIFPTPLVEWRPRFTLRAHINESFYWSRMLAATMNGIPILGVKPIKGVILAGLPGTGRHTTADGLAGSLQENRGIRYFLRVSGCALDTEDVANACGVIDGVVSKLREHRKLCLVLDCPEQSRHSRAIQEYLLQQYLDHPEELFIILITDSVANISPLLIAELTVCQFRKPDLAARQKWLHSNMTRKNMPINIDGMTHMVLAQETEGFNWRQMTELREQMRRAIAFKYLNDPLTYNPDGIPDLENKLWTEGKIHLTTDDVYTILGLLREQNGAVTVSGAPAVQMVVSSAIPAAAAPQAAATVPSSGGTADGQMEDSSFDDFSAMSEEEAKAAIEFHSNPALMSFSDLTNISGL